MNFLNLHFQSLDLLGWPCGLAVREDDRVTMADDDGRATTLFRNDDGHHPQFPSSLRSFKEFET